MSVVSLSCVLCCKQKTAYEMRISDWSSDVCSSDLAMVLLMPRSFLVAGVSIASLIFLALLGAIGARAGGANVARATLRVTFWGALAMALTAGKIGRA